MLGSDHHGVADVTEPQPASITTTETTDAIAITIAGELDILSTGELDATFDRAIERGADASVDLADVTFIDSSALRTLVNAHTALTRAGQRLVLVAPSATVLRILELSGLADHFTVES